MYSNKSNAFTDSNKINEKGFSVKSKTLLLSTTAFMAGAMLMPSSAMAVDDFAEMAVDDFADWDALNIVEGAADVLDTGLGETTINQSSIRAIGEADELHVGTSGHIIINQAAADALLVVRDIGLDSDPTQILGRITSNGDLIIIDPNGVFFGKDSEIDVTGITTTTGELLNADIMDGNDSFTFNNVGAGGSIIIEGKITVNDAGLAAFVSPFITNHGVINAKLGNVVMAAGETVTLDLYGDGLLELAVDGELADALIENNNQINAEGGYVQVSASAAKGTVDNVVNNKGLITVASATVDGGKIILSGGDKGTVKNSGEVVTSTGGEINISGERFVQDSVPVVVDAEAFQLDEITPIPAVKPRIVGAGGDITIATSGNVEILDGRVEAKGGDITIKNGGIFKSLNVNTLRTEGEGTITLSQNAGSEETGSIQNAIDAINNTGTGQNTIHVGAGTYNESVNVDHANLALNGANADIHGSAPERGAESIIAPNSPGFLVTADNATINGFAIVGTGSDAGVEVDGADSVTVSNNTMAGFEYGVLADAANGLNVHGNFVDSASIHGMHITNSDDIVVGANDIDGSNLDGIRVEGGKRAVITYNTVDNSGDDGIDVDDNDYVIIDTNIIDATQLNVVSTDGNAIEVSRSKKARISYNQTSNTGADGVDIKSSHDANVYENTVTDAGDDGIDVDRVERINVYNNTITNTGGEGLEITSAQKGNFHHNIITNAGDDGIDVKLSDDIKIQTNTIDVTGSDGVQLVDSERALIDDNGITNTGENGVLIENALDATISNNAIDATGTNGIYVSGSNNADVLGNIVINAGEHGIKVNPSDDVEIIGNFVFGSFFDGIRVNDGKRAIIDGNFVDLSGDDGIDVDNNDDVIIRNNVIDVTQLHPDATDGNAIEVSRSDRADISFNTTSNTGADGVDVKSSRDVKVYENIVTDAGDDGIDVDNVVDIEVYDNDVDGTGGEGIEVTKADSGNFHGNTIKNVGDDGIDVKLSNDIVLQKNHIHGVVSDGIQLVDSERALIKKNRIRDTGENGVFIENALDATISWNDIKDTGTNGIYISGSNNADVKFNAVRNAGEHGIKVNPSDDVEITGNFVFNSFFDGIRVDDGKRAVISYNIVKKSGDDGIDVNDNDDVAIKKNVISVTGQHPDATDGNAIEVANSDRAQIFENHASFTQADGVDVKSSRDVKVYNNKVRFAGDDGIDVDNTKNIEIYDNDVKITGGEGIEVTKADNGYIHNNSLKTVGDDGIDVKLSNDIRIEGNTIDVTGSDGVQLVDSERALIDDNDITNSGENGIYTLNAPDATISNNVIDTSGANGVYVSTGSGTTIIGNTISNSVENNVKVNPSDFVNIHDNRLSFAGEDGINVRGGTGHDIRGNYIFHALNDGIDVREFGNGWIAYNNIQFTGDDGVDVRDGNFVSIYDNYIDLSGYLPNNVVTFGPFARNVEVGEDANGIYVSNVGGGDLPPASETDGFASSSYGASVEIYGNEVSNSEDDGIQVEGRYEKPRLKVATIEGGDSGDRSAYIAHNIVGHVGDDGIDVDGIDVTYVKGNAVTLAGDKGITIDGGRYAGVFDNRVLLTGNDGIQVENVYGGLDAMILGDINYGYGWSVNVSGNEVALTGADGIEVRNSGPTKVAHNNVFIAGLGKDLGEVIDTVNSFANGTFTFAPPFLAPQIQDIEDDFEGFGWEWGNGHGINVHGISGAYYSPNGWAADIRGNTVQYTGGHGILVEDNDRTIVKRNGVRYAGIDYTYFYGTDGMLEMLDSGAFASDERRDLWMSSDDSLVSVMEGYFGIEEEPKENPKEETDYINILDVEFDSYDGIHAENIRSNVFVTGALRDGEGQKEIVEGGYGYDLQIVGNRINTTGDDGIEVDGAGRTLIGWNRIRNAGYGDDVPYRGDRTGADGIHVSGVFNNNILTAPTFAGVDGSGYYGYAVNIIGNKINTTGDDGIAVVDSSSAYIANNRIHNAGYHGGSESEALSFEGDRRRGTRFGSDGIHVRNVYGEEFGSVGSLGVDYAVVIQGNKINTTGDDGIEVRNAGRTLIDSNRIRNAGFGGGRDYNGGDRYGADGIFVTNVYANEFVDYPYPEDENSERVLFSPTNLGNSVIITNNKVNYTGDDGIEVQNSGSTLIDSNRVRNTGDDGIAVMSNGFFGPDVNLLQGDTISIFEGKGASVIITNNKVKNAGGDGIHTTNIEDLVISDNEVRDSYEHGVYVSGGYNGYVEFQGNTLEDNGQFSGSAQARFESGDIDMSDLERPNMFINTTGVPATALQFDDVFGSLPDSEDDIESVEFLGGTGLRIVGETLGSTVFDGYLPEGSFYVRFEDGSILNPDTNLPILIDANSVSFGGVVPGEFVGEFLSSDERQFIEDRLFDADDETVDGRGQIFEDLPEEASIENIQDFFDNFNNQNAASNQARVTINGLPSIGNGLGTLNDITPAAGGGEGSEFADINPAAGGEGSESQEVTCMDDAVNSLNNGSVTYNFGGTFEDGIASEAGCTSRNI